MVDKEQKSNSQNTEVFQNGDMIFEEGSFGDCSYIIEKGRVEIYVTIDQEHVRLKILGTGEIFGEMSVIDGSPRSASARALEDCELTVISSAQISERIEDSDPIVSLLINILLQRMRLLNRHAKQLESSPILQALPEEESQKLIDEHQNEPLAKMRLESELKDALKKNQFLAYYQPIIDLSTGQIAGFEALLRWESPQRGMVRPDVFIGVAEETSLIIPLGYWIIERSCQDLVTLQREIAAQGLDIQLFMSINISGRQFQDKAFLDNLCKIVQRYNIAPRNIKLEITEGTLMAGIRSTRVVERCQQRGFKIALDDFGTGYSSMGYLMRFAVDNIKVDKGFVIPMFENDRTRVLTNAIIQLAQGLDNPTIAEGIETPEHHRALRKMGCDYGQGYLYSRPVPLEKVRRFIGSSFRHFDAP
ncbi:MAG: EAL domain-containing protein [Myxococcota bacterium]|nr:EAL domain-containing protein [Myxococcota bacterium]